MENVGNYLHVKTIVALPFPRFHLCELTAIEGVSLKLENHQLPSLGPNISFPSIIRELDSGRSPSHALVCSSPSLFSAQEQGCRRHAFGYPLPAGTLYRVARKLSGQSRHCRRRQTASVSYLYAVTRAPTGREVS